MSANTAMLQDLGINNGNTPVDNEIAIMGSPDLMRDVVRRLRLNISYSTRKGIRTEDLYGSTLPVTVTMPDIPEEDNASFKLHLQSNGDFTITDLKLKRRLSNVPPSMDVSACLSAPRWAELQLILPKDSKRWPGIQKSTSM